MKKILLFLSAVIFVHFSDAQSVGIGTTTPNTNAALEIKSNNKGVLMPRLSSSSRNGMANVQKGMMVYDSTLSAFYYHDGSKWREFSERNTDSLTYSGSINTPQTTANMAPVASNIITSEASGILYDNGGPMANYANASTDAYVVYQANNDSIIGYKVIVEQMNLAPGDTLGIYVAGDESSIVFFSGNKTGTFYFAATSGLIFGFNSNASGNAAGFKIRWGVVNAISASNATPPLYGWYFNDKKIAVRGGINSAYNLVPDSIGRLSFAYGGNAKAKGVNAMAVGSVVSASGDYSRAMGLQSTASGNNSTAIGQMAVAQGDMSFAHGFKAFAAGYGSVAFGNNNEVNGDRTFAFGSANKVLQRSGIAIGIGNTVSAENSVAIGIGNNVLNVNTIALGISATASSPNSTALGFRAEASGNNATALGDSARATGLSATSLGSYTTASGRFSTALGVRTIARPYASFVIGSYNAPLAGSTSAWVATDPLFVIGNGIAANSTSNAFMVLKNGNTGIGTDAPAANLHIKHAGGGGLILENANDNNKWRIYSASGDNNLTFYNNADVEVADIDDVTGTFSAISDSRLKKNIEDMQPVLTSLIKLKPSYYQFNWQQQNDQKQIGLLAQDAHQYFPELVSYNKEKDLYKMNYAGFSIVAIKAIQEQQVIIEKQQKQISSLQKETEKIASLELKIVAIEKLLLSKTSEHK